MRILKIALCLLLLVPVAAQEEDLDLPYFSREEFAAWRDTLRNFDEVRMTLAQKIVEQPSEDGSGKFVRKVVLDEPLHSETGITDSESFLALLEFEEGVVNSVHGCYGLFNLAFHKRGERIGRLHYAHGKYWQPLTQKSQDAISRWLAQRGFPIEETKELEKEETNQQPQQQRP